MKLVDYEVKTSQMTKDEVAKHRLAVDYAKLDFERKRLWISVFGAGVAALGLYFGYSNFTAGLQAQRDLQSRQAEAAAADRKSRFESEIALEFFRLSPDEQPAYVQNLASFGDIDPILLDKLNSALPSRPDLDPSSMQDAEAEVADKLNAIVELLNDLTSDDTAERRGARTGLSRELLDCADQRCLSLVNEYFEVEQLVSSSRYRMALGITVAFDQLNGSLNDQGSEFQRVFADGELNANIRRKVAVLSGLNEPAISNSASRVLAKLN